MTRVAGSELKIDPAEIAADKGADSGTSFVEACVETVADSAVQAEKKNVGKGRARKFLRALVGKKNILITTHRYPDPDAMASCIAMLALLKHKMPGVKVDIAIQGNLLGGMNSMFAELTELRVLPWDEALIAEHDAVILLDAQPHFSNSPLPTGYEPTVVIDHHRTMRHKCKSDFCDIRSDVGATGTIIFSYFMELESPISRALGATLLYAIESDLAGSAGKPGELDNMALSSLTLLADTGKLYQMRYVDLPQNYYIAYAHGVNNAMYYDTVLISHLEKIDTPEKPAVIADFLLRFEKVEWALVTAHIESRLVLSLRTRTGKNNAADAMRKLVRGIGTGGGHRTKAGGVIRLSASPSEAEIQGFLKQVKQRMLRATGIKNGKGARLVPRGEGSS
ncbi:MAG TPA: DHH family phosphoesterase [Tepidisphaeraceae bacterium]|jgi:nanoRNase/pAp phosphatase (c-di-AMP/oligoRNAs hydrolase)